MKKIMFFRPLYSLGGTEIAMLNLVKKLKGYDLYIGYSDQTSDKHLLDRFAEYATIVDLNEVEDFEVDNFITCSAHYNLVEAVKNIKSGVSIFGINGTLEAGSSSGESVEYSANEDAIITGTLRNYTNDRVTNIRECAFQRMATASAPEV